MKEQCLQFRQKHADLYEQMVHLQDNSDDLVIRFKRIIKSKLISDPRIIHVLHNENLSEDHPDDYLDVNILSRVNLPDIQAEVANYICFKIDIGDTLEANQRLVKLDITFQILCRDGDIKTEFGIDRHDLLAYLVKDMFHLTNTFWNQCRCKYDSETLTDSHYNGRLLKFEVTVPNGMVETKNDVARNRNIGVRS